MHMTATGGNCCGVGDRIPAAWFWSKTTKLHICSGVNNAGNTCYNSSPLPLNKYTNILIKQEREGEKIIYSIAINGKVVKRLQNLKPREYKNVKIWAADNWYVVANADMKNLVIIPDLGMFFLLRIK